ncbi:MAG: sugar ABC transporter permease, partial [Clostridia bacterium]|nr:sugar ABC transporter permease [Clostridia bacterium]
MKTFFKRHAGLLKKDLIVNKGIYFMLIPVVVYYFIFHYWPMYGALIAFKDYTPKLGVAGSPWVGMKHFINFFQSPSFLTVLGNTVRISLTTLLWNFPAPIILALLINELKSAKFAKVVQTCTYLPHFISLIVVCGMVKDFTRDTGIITYILSFFGVPKVSLLGYPQYFLPIYVGSAIWQQVG